MCNPEPGGRAGGLAGYLRRLDSLPVASLAAGKEKRHNATFMVIMIRPTSLRRRGESCVGKPRAMRIDRDPSESSPKQKGRHQHSIRPSVRSKVGPSYQAARPLEAAVHRQVSYVAW